VHQIAVTDEDRDMLLEPTADQEFFRDTTAKFLTDQMPIDRLRWLGENRATPEAAEAEAEFWERGADLGWASLLVSEEAGGGSISGQGVADLSLIAYEFGRHAAPGPLVPVNLVAAALDDTGSHPDVLAELLVGAEVAAWCHAERGTALGDARLVIRRQGGDLVLSGVKRPVEVAAGARYLLVTGQLDGGLTQVLVPADSPGVTVTPLVTTDWTRRLGAVAFDEVRVPDSALVGPAAHAAAQVDRQLELALVVAAAEATGAMQAGFDMTLAWAFDRYSFGRPLASYQALKHRFADMKSWLEASHAIADEAAAAVGEGGARSGELASAAKAYVGQYGTELMHECVQMHGGIGLTREHDLHLFLRRVTLNRTLYGTPAQHRQRVAGYVTAREGLS
jgi:alkylation response protein AidB-like acyl-CoA dehydrogenase